MKVHVLEAFHYYKDIVQLKEKILIFRDSLHKD